jgi:hypothetical protein
LDFVAVVSNEFYVKHGGCFPSAVEKSTSVAVRYTGRTEKNASSLMMEARLAPVPF